ncbi:MAG: lysozyme [Bacteroidaceae bacterium]|nr:lysozyme [Bacteroidaceae bacterium]
MQISDKGLQMIIAFEGLELKAYKCPAGVWTIGVGHTGGVDGLPISRGLMITEEQAMALLREDVGRFERYLNRQSFAKILTQGMFDALVSFIFNVGTGAFQTSTMRKKLCMGASAEEVAREFGKWVYGTVGGKKEKLPGLVKRRRRECEMFLSEQ